MESPTRPADPSYEVFSKCNIFQGLDEKEVKLLFSITKEKKVEKGMFLIQEGEQADDIYIVIEGSFDILIRDPEIQIDHKISTALPGDSIGEIAFLDHGPRTTSVRAVDLSRVRSLSSSDFRAILEKNRELQHFLYSLSESICRKMRNANNSVVHALRNELIESKLRAKLGQFVIFFITMLSLFSFAVPTLHHLLISAPDSTYITLPLNIFAGLFIFFFVKVFDMPLELIGITSKNWKRSLFEGFFFTIPFCVVIVIGVKVLLSVDAVDFPNRPLIDPFSLISNPADKTWTTWLELNAVYVFFMVPLQEILARGNLQGLLEKFLTGKHRVLISIVTSNLVFGALHAFYSPILGIAIMFVGFYIGWLYSRTHNLLGCCVAHAIVGVLGLGILGTLPLILDGP